MRNHLFLHSLIGLLMMAGIFTSCQEDDQEPEVNPLVARAGADQLATTGATVNLDASASTDASGANFSYNWTFKSKPNGSNSVILDANNAEATFQPDSAGNYDLLLTISRDKWSATDELRVTVERNPLVAKAGADQQAKVGDPVTLDGSSSSDSEGKAINYQWSLHGKPEGSNAAITAPQAAVTTFQPDKPGEYVLVLTISRETWSATDTLYIWASAEVPVPNEAIPLSDNIVADRILTDVFPNDPSKADYIVTHSIQVDAKLTIEPGVRIAFALDSRLNIGENGTLKAIGSGEEGKNIIFEGMDHIPGYWDGIAVYSASIDNTLSYVKITDSGGAIFPSADSRTLFLENNSRMDIEHCIFEKNLGTAVYLMPYAELGRFAHNKLVGQPNGEENVMALPAAQISNISNNNEFWNGAIGVITAGLFTGKDEMWGSYTFELPFGLHISDGTTLWLADGAFIKVGQDRAIHASGGSAIIAIGLEPYPIKIEGMVPQAGSWRGIYIENSGTKNSEFAFCHIWHAGGQNLHGNQRASVMLGVGGTASFYGTSISSGNGDGVVATAQGARILAFHGVTVRGHSGYPIAVSVPNVVMIEHLTYFTNNAKPYVRIDAALPLEESQATYWEGFNQVNMSYLVEGGGNRLTIRSGLNLNPGVILQMAEGSSIKVEATEGKIGYLRTLGNANAPVLIKGQEGAPGWWHGIHITTNSELNFFEHTSILHGGKDWDLGFGANILLNENPAGKLRLVNTKVGQSGQHGIAVANSLRANLLDESVVYEGIPASGVHTW